VRMKVAEDSTYC